MVRNALSDMCPQTRATGLRNVGKQISKRDQVLGGQHCINCIALGYHLTILSAAMSSHSHTKQMFALVIAAKILGAASLPEPYGQQSHTVRPVSDGIPISNTKGLCA